jgi:hypothetical protein
MEEEKKQTTRSNAGGTSDIANNRQICKMSLSVFLSKTCDTSFIKEYIFVELPI